MPPVSFRLVAEEPDTNCKTQGLLTPDLDTTIYNLCILLLTDMVDSFVASMKTLLEEPTHSEGELTPNH
jgi:hypothetical protein